MLLTLIATPPLFEWIVRRVRAKAEPEADVLKGRIIEINDLWYGQVYVPNRFDIELRGFTDWDWQIIGNGHGAIAFLTSATCIEGIEGTIAKMKGKMGFAMKFMSDEAWSSFEVDHVKSDPPPREDELLNPMSKATGSDFVGSDEYGMKVSERRKLQ